MIFESTRILLSSSNKGKGNLVYWYSNPHEKNRGFLINGLVDLNWNSKHPETKINKMSGLYYGKTSRDIGTIEYLRITEEE